MHKYFLLVFSVTIWLNQVKGQNADTDWANLHKYAADNILVKSKPAAAKKVVLKGDSITEFWSGTDSGFFAANNLINRGISGQTTAQMLVRFRPDVIDLQPKKVVILAGINDIAENTGPITTEAIFGNIVSMIQLAQANKIKVVLCSVLPANQFPWRLQLQPAQKVITLNSMLKAYATKNHIPFVNYYNAMVNDSLGLKKEYGDDGVHPNLAGYQVMERLLLPNLQ